MRQEAFGRAAASVGIVDAVAFDGAAPSRVEGGFFVVGAIEVEIANRLKAKELIAFKLIRPMRGLSPPPPLASLGAERFRPVGTNPAKARRRGRC